MSRIDHAEARRNYLTAIRIGCVFGVFRALFLPIRLRVIVSICFVGAPLGHILVDGRGVFVVLTVLGILESK